MEKNGNNIYLVAGAIVLAGLLIGFGIYFGGKNAKNNDATAKKDLVEKIDIKPVSENDHILGNPKADVVIVEFSDIECPFCKTFHETINKIMSEYAKDGRVAWVYRHFPLASLHSKAETEAQATECAEELGGNAGFWNYINKLYEITPSNNGLDLNKLPEIAAELGIDKTKFEECQKSKKYEKKVQEQLEDAINSGGTGTPYNIIITKNSDKYVVNGAAPYLMMKSVVDTVLDSIDTGKSYEATNDAVRKIMGQ